MPACVGRPVAPVAAWRPQLAPVAALVPVRALESCEENDSDAPVDPLEVVVAASV